jgi:hypothetical protein
MNTEYDFERERILFAAQSASMIDKLKRMLEHTKLIEEALRNEIQQKENVMKLAAHTPRKRSRL